MYWHNYFSFRVTLVLEFIFFFILSTAIKGELLSISTKTGFKLALITANAVEQYVIAGIMTSEPSFKFKAFKANVKASVPFATPIEYLDPQNLENSSSNFLTPFPSIKSFFFNKDLRSFKKYLNRALS